MARVELFLDDDAGIVAEFPDQLIRPDIDGVDAQGTALEEAVREAAGGCADVDADPTGRVNLEGVERALEFQPAAANETGLVLDCERSIGCELGAGLVEHPIAAADFAGQDEAFGLFAGVAEAAEDEELVKAVFFHSPLRCSRSRSRPKSPLKSRQVAWTWLASFWTLQASIRKVGPWMR